jgi:hypothetical protein
LSVHRFDLPWFVWLLLFRNRGEFVSEFFGGVVPHCNSMAFGVRFPTVASEFFSPQGVDFKELTKTRTVESFLAEVVRAVLRWFAAEVSLRKGRARC